MLGLLFLEPTFLRLPDPCMPDSRLHHNLRYSNKIDTSMGAFLPKIVITGTIEEAVMAYLPNLTVKCRTHKKSYIFVEMMYKRKAFVV
jgi:hypothetical protein